MDNTKNAAKRLFCPSDPRVQKAIRRRSCEDKSLTRD